MWDWCKKLLNLNILTPQNLELILSQWMNPGLSKVGTVLWRALWVSTIWNIWKERNRRTFEGTQSEIEVLKSNTLATAAEWFSTNKDCKFIPKSHIFDNPFEVAKLNIDRQTRIAIWMPPHENCLKLNFDGSSIGNPDSAGYGGTIRDHMGNYKFTYSNHVDIQQ
ncbi:uncharacterized protein LOC110007815 [Amborella trichopoda]|uniref:uncharacterized protein LOC110007815 n=1 Tax=Amborella trichopoda TaxID=13333 RepID=UPI0009C01743|nr:uncharacterized protein LOC110007815 [Amborella trichopoda]|eukprot:XP_020526893.1 uncharacterized protein LOC110007815 [Amborella trichopoda]